MYINEYKKFEELTIAELMLLKQAYVRCVAEGYNPGWDYNDFVDIVTGRGDHTILRLHEIETLEEANKPRDTEADMQAFNNFLGMDVEESLSKLTIRKG